MAFSPDGSRIATGGWDCTINIWDVKTGNLLKEIPNSGIPTAIAFSSNGDKIAFSSRAGTTRLLNLRTDIIENELKEDNSETYVLSIEFSPNDKLIYTGNIYGKIKIWDFQKNQTSIKKVQHNSNKFSSIAFSKNLNRIVTSEFLSNFKIATVTVWNIDSIQHKAIVWNREDNNKASYIPPFAFSPNKKIIAKIRDDNKIVIQDLDSNEIEKILIGHKSLISSIVFSTDGNKLLSGGSDSLAILWNIPNAKAIQIFNTKQPISAVSFYNNDKDILVSSFSDYESVTQLINLEIGRSEKIFRNNLLSLSHVSGKRLEGSTPLKVSIDNKYLLVLDINDNAVLYDIQTTFVKKVFNISSLNTISVAFSPDNKTIAFGLRDDPSIKFFNLENGSLEKQLIGHHSPVSSIEFSSDGKKILTGSWEGTVKIWDIENGFCEKTFVNNYGYITTATYSKDSSEIMAGGVWSLDRWNAKESCVECRAYNFSLKEMSVAGLNIVPEDSSKYLLDSKIYEKINPFNNSYNSSYQEIKKMQEETDYIEFINRSQNWKNTDEYTEYRNKIDSLKTEYEKAKGIDYEQAVSEIKKEIEKVRQGKDTIKILFHIDLLIDSLEKLYALNNGYQKELSQALDDKLTLCFQYKSFKEAEAAGKRCLTLNSELSFVKVNLAHALLFQDKYEDAKNMYLDFIDDLQIATDKSNADLLILELKYLETKGFKHKDLQRMKKEFEQKKKH